MAKPRYEREIEELLSQLEFSPPPPRKRKPGFGQRLGEWLRYLGRIIDPPKLLLLGLVLLLVGWIAVGALGTIGQVMVLVGALFLVGAYILYLMQRSQKPQSARWRGRVIEMDPEPTLIERWIDDLRRRFQRR